MAVATMAPTDYWTEAPAPGLYRGTPDEDYRRWSAINSSTLRRFARSALHGRYAMLNPKEASEAQEFGTAVHKAILEPDIFRKAFQPMPYFGKRQSSKVRDEEDAFRAAHPDITFLPEAEFAHCMAIRDAVWAHPTAAEILKAQGANELSAVWKDAETGLPCKGRQDKFCNLGSWPTVMDLKSAEDASKLGFSKSIDKFGYAEQAAFYLDGFHTLAPFPEGERRYVFIVAEKEPPYAVAVYELDPTAIEVGRKRYRANLRTYAGCLEAGTWPGYGDGMDLISLPPWSMKSEE